MRPAGLQSSSYLSVTRLAQAKHGVRPSAGDSTVSIAAQIWSEVTRRSVRGLTGQTVTMDAAELRATSRHQHRHLVFHQIRAKIIIKQIRKMSRRYQRKITKTKIINVLCCSLVDPVWANMDTVGRRSSCSVSFYSCCFAVTPDNPHSSLLIQLNESSRCDSQPNSTRTPGQGVGS